MHLNLDNEASANQGDTFKYKGVDYVRKRSVAKPVKRRERAKRSVAHQHGEAIIAKGSRKEFF